MYVWEPTKEDGELLNHSWVVWAKEAIMTCGWRMMKVQMAYWLTFEIILQGSNTARLLFVHPLWVGCRGEGQSLRCKRRRREMLGQGYRMIGRKRSSVLTFYCQPGQYTFWMNMDSVTNLPTATHDSHHWTYHHICSQISIEASIKGALSPNNNIDLLYTAYSDTKRFAIHWSYR